MIVKTEGSTRFRQWRRLEGLTLEEVSGLTGVSVPMLSLVERDKRRFGPRTKILVARRLGVSVSSLFPPELVEVESLRPGRDGNGS